MFRPRPVRTLAASALALALVAAGCGDDDDTTTSESTSAGTETTAAGGPDTTAASTAELPDKLTFAAIPSEEATDLEELYGKVFEVFKADTGIEIELLTVTNYAAAVEAMRTGNVDLALFGPFSYYIAEQQGVDLDAIVGQVTDKGNDPGYHSLGFAKADNADVNAIEDYAGKNICFVDPGSTSGYLYPYKGLADAGIDLNSDLEAIYAGGHDTSIQGVASGQCDAGFAADTNLLVDAVDSGMIAADEMKLVWESPLIPASPVAVRADMDAALKTVLADEFAKINVDYMIEKGQCEAGSDACLPDGVYGFGAMDDSAFDDIRVICEETQAESCEAS